MKRWQFFMGCGLVGLSAVIYVVQIALFGQAKDTFFYLFQDLAFLPIQVLLVTLIISEVLTLQEKRAILKKLNMVIGVFFSDVGTGLLRHFSELDLQSEEIRKRLMEAEWSDHYFFSLRKGLETHGYRVAAERKDLGNLKIFLAGKKDFLLRLLENPNLLEHERFTELLWAVFHLAEELSLREDVHSCSEADCAHLIGDIKRAYGLLLSEWLSYMLHLKKSYPYLFSLAIRLNPFDPAAAVEIK
jgi:hypothetical protein